MLTYKQIMLNGYKPYLQFKDFFGNPMTNNFKKADYFKKTIKIKFGDLPDNIQEFYYETYDFHDKEQEINIEFKLLKEDNEWILYCSEIAEYYDYKIDNIDDLKKKEKEHLSMFKKKYQFDDYSFIYIIKCIYGIKIGVSNNPFNRISQIKTSSPFNIDLLHILFIDKKHVYKIEKGLHKHFKDKKISGEWFNLNEIDLKIIYLSYVLFLPLYSLDFIKNGDLSIKESDLSIFDFYFTDYS